MWVTVVDGSITLDQQLYAISSVIEGVDLVEVRKSCTTLDPWMDLSTREDDEEKLDTTRRPHDDTSETDVTRGHDSARPIH